jgi:hypothetical protein
MRRVAPARRTREEAQVRRLHQASLHFLDRLEHRRVHRDEVIQRSDDRLVGLPERKWSRCGNLAGGARDGREVLRAVDHRIRQGRAARPHDDEADCGARERTRRLRCARRRPRSPRQRHPGEPANTQNSHRNWTQRRSQLEHAKELMDQGKDCLFYGAPAVMVVHAESWDTSSAFNCALALYNCSLMAHALGVGCCFNGYLQGAANNSRRIKKWLGIPHDHRCFGAMTLGYQGVRYRRLVKRDSAKVVWR